MDTRIDPNIPPLSANELAHDTKTSPQGNDQPTLTEAQEGKDVTPADDDASEHGNQAGVVDKALTNLPPG